MKKYMIILLLASGMAAGAHAQILRPVKWSYAAKRSANGRAVLLFKATIDKGWHIYSQRVEAGGPVATSFHFDPAPFYLPEGKTAEPAAIARYESSFGMNVRYFEGNTVFTQKIRLKGKGRGNVSGKLEFMVCNDKQCIPPEELTFNIPVK